jgi:hypothetical protein
MLFIQMILGGVYTPVYSAFEFMTRADYMT